MFNNFVAKLNQGSLWMRMGGNGKFFSKTQFFRGKKQAANPFPVGVYLADGLALFNSRVKFVKASVNESTKSIS